MDGVRNPVCSEFAKPSTASRTTGPRCTCTAASRRGSATARRISGSRRPERTPPWPQGVSVKDVPDMNAANVANDGVQTFYYTNQQSARLMFYHDHAWGITRLNVYAGEAAGYLITDETEKELVSTGTIPGAADTIPLVVQDRTFVPQDPQLYDRRTGGQPHLLRPGPDLEQDPLGRRRQLLVPPRVHAGAEPRRRRRHERLRPLDVRSVVLAAGRRTVNRTDPQPVLRPGLRPRTSRPPGSTTPTRSASRRQIPGTPNISAGMEQFNDTPIVNGVAYPEVTLEPQDVSLPHAERGQRPLLQLPVVRGRSVDGHRQRSGAESAAELAAAQTDPTVFPTPVHNASSPTAPTGSRSAPRAASCRPRPSSTASSPPPGSPTRRASTSATSTSTRCCWRPPSGPT